VLRVIPRESVPQRLSASTPESGIAGPALSMITTAQAMPLSSLAGRGREWPLECSKIVTSPSLSPCLAAHLAPTHPISCTAPRCSGPVSLPVEKSRAVASVTAEWLQCDGISPVSRCDFWQGRGVRRKCGLGPCCWRQCCAGANHITVQLHVIPPTWTLDNGPACPGSPESRG